MNQKNYELCNALSMLFPTFTLIYYNYYINYNIFVEIQTIGFISLVPYSILYHYSVYYGNNHNLLIFDLVSQHIGISIIAYSLSNSFLYTSFCTIINSSISINLILSNINIENISKSDMYFCNHSKKLSLCYLMAFLPMIYRRDYYNFIMTILYSIISIDCYNGKIRKYILGIYGHTIMHIMLSLICYHTCNSASKIIY